MFSYKPNKIYIPFEKNYETLMSELKWELNKWRAILYLWVGILNVFEISVFKNLIYTLIVIPIKIPALYFMAIDKLIIKFRWKGKRPRIAHTILKKSKAGGLTYLTLRFMMKLQYSRKSDISQRIKKVINGTDREPQK